VSERESWEWASVQESEREYVQASVRSRSKRPCGSWGGSMFSDLVTVTQ
jgi:hypothetical protein